MRNSTVIRKTSETDITLYLELDGKGKSEISTQCGFLDHMLTLFARHGRFDLTVKCAGDCEVDYHHTAEDIAICLGSAFSKALGEKRGITRYGNAVIPMDETLILSSADISGRGGAFLSLDIPAQKVGSFDTELCAEFWYAFAREAGITFHIRQLTGTNSHHIIEGVFKSAARALREAVSIDADIADEVPSTKGIL